MNQFTEIDIKHMSLALRLAKKGLYTAHPNPRVGCVITSNEKVIGKGWHEVTGEDHAEIMAMISAWSSPVTSCHPFPITFSFEVITHPTRGLG